MLDTLGDMVTCGLVIAAVLIIPAAIEQHRKTGDRQYDYTTTTLCPKPPQHSRRIL
jgi:hypothetical protein